LLPTTYNQSFLYLVKSGNGIMNKFTKLEVFNFQGANAFMYALAQLNLTHNKIKLRIIYEEISGGIICYKQINCFDTSKSANIKIFDNIVNNLKLLSSMTKQKIVELQESYKKLDMLKSYQGIFSSLWYGASSCVGIQGITSINPPLPDVEYAQLNSLDRSFLKYCSWKGVPIECAAIFKTIPTDSGLCCAFNMKLAEDIYRSRSYTNLVKNLQDYERNNTVSDPSLPNWYTSFGEPNSFAGRKKGLFVILDAHGDLIANTSLQQDYLSINGLVSYSGSFPYMAEEAFEVKPGYHNIISLNAMRVDADDSMHSLEPDSRNCRFYDESSILKIYKNYTYSNCLFECGLLKAYDIHKCIPWYFPFYDDTFLICDPWVTKDFLDYMSNTVSENCEKCLPECSTTLFDLSIATRLLKY